MMKDQIRQVRRMLSDVRDQLVRCTPDSVSICAAILEHAVEVIVDLELAVRQAPEEDRRSLQSDMQFLRQDLHQVGALLAQAAQLQIGYAQLIGAIAASYDPSGSVSTPETPHPAVEMEA